MPEQNTGSEFCPISTSGAAQGDRSHGASNRISRTQSQVSARIEISRNGYRPVLSSTTSERKAEADTHSSRCGCGSITVVTTTPSVNDHDGGGIEQPGRDLAAAWARTPAARR